MEGSRTHVSSGRVALAGVIVLVVTLLACAGAAEFVRTGGQARIGRYQVSGLQSPELGVLLTLSICEGSVRHVTSYGIREPRAWFDEDGALIIHQSYRGTDPNCQYS